jgi:hypothetical protein
MCENCSQILYEIVNTRKNDTHGSLANFTIQYRCLTLFVIWLCSIHLQNQKDYGVRAQVISVNLF